MPTKAKKDGNARHIAKLDLIKIQPYKEEGAAIRAAAAAVGQSVQAYVLRAVRSQMAREGAIGAVNSPGVVSIPTDSNTDTISPSCPITHTDPPSPDTEAPEQNLTV